MLVNRRSLSSSVAAAWRCFVADGAACGPHQSVAACHRRREAPRQAVGGGTETGQWEPVSAPACHRVKYRIHENPELAYQEFQAHENITSFINSHGFDVTSHAYGLETAFSADYGTGGRLVTFNCEYDALPIGDNGEKGHACGHNLIATSAIAAYLGTAWAIKKYGISGRVRLLGTPAEEGGGGKIKLIDAGAYEGVDACLMTHPMSKQLVPTLGKETGIAYGASVASIKFLVAFTGKPAHGALTPHEGVNALDAAVLAYNGISMLRQQIKPAERLGGVILQGGQYPNVITPKSKLSYNVRSSTLKEAQVLYDRAVKCFEGTALATGCRVDIELMNRYAEVVPNGPLCEAYSTIMSGLDSPQVCNIAENPFPGSYSTDMGNVSQVVPGFHPIYTIPTPEKASNHTPEFAAAAGTDEAYRLTIDTAKGMAATAWKMLTDDEFAASVKEEFEKPRGILPNRECDLFAAAPEHIRLIVNEIVDISLGQHYQSETLGTFVITTLEDVTSAHLLGS
ncbi:hypothetical protein V495_00598 [Pseudogymnoascus sp. VKM F-4514 (FW-929)]|nr:hypothetical protein V495_00598 [Pseudogymnoascus sp. VKM F-4514 (FW-929)]KFY66022.1 hypothetical protein V497_01128 [Pseudogymnoascus sp. VKM F-4516 (FW-969)]